jgi:DNA polymerase III subunit gamma/tau
MERPASPAEPRSSAPTTGRRGEYVVVARRYRPQSFAELVGQEHIAQALSGAIVSGRVGHAYLFTGARGVGKTSAARILAKALNCTSGPTPTPCNECDTCISISTGDDVDVLEIDGASNRGIDEIRELRQKVNVRPSRSRSKVYIIDEVHMLTREAFNALLKTLEEPPEHVKFIFCTTEPEKIPITILSRCQRFDFAGIQTPSIVQRLRQIVAAEGVQAEPAALEILARRAAGSMRDSQSLLEQLLAFGGSSITVADVHRMLGTAADGRLAPLVAHLAERDAAAALSDLDAALGEGVDVGQLLDQLLGYFRDLLVLSVGCGEDAVLHAAAAEAAKLKGEAQQLGIDTILAIMQILDQTMARLRYSTHARTLAELALVRICQLEDLDQLPALMAELRGGPPVERSPAPAARLAPPPASRPMQPAAEAKKKDEPSLAAEAECPSQAPLLSPAASAVTLWQKALEGLPLATLSHAEHAIPQAIIAPNRLVLGFRQSYNYAKSFCERPEQVARLEKALQAAAGVPLTISFETLADLPEQKQESTAQPRRSSGAELLQEKMQEPLVRRAAELFGAHPMKVETPS